MKRRHRVFAALLAVGVAAAGRSSELEKNLDIYFLDMMGGLIKVSVDPDRESFSVSIGVDGPKNTYAIK